MTPAMAIFKQNISEKDFLKLKDFVESYCGIKMPATKKQMVEGRIRKRVRSLGLEGYGEYMDYVFSDKGEIELVNLIDVLTTNKTDFFREPSHFSFLQEKVLPHLLQQGAASSTRPVKVWSAGCSTGEEPYTLAMVLAEFFRGFSSDAYKITATDICTDVLKKAAEAVYGEDKVANIPYEIKKKYLLRSKDRASRKVKIGKNLRSKIQFKRLNFMDDKFPLEADYDIIFCRNVIIYFERDVQERVLQKLLSHLKPGGFLFLGHSETIHGMTLPVETVFPTVYRKV